MAKKYYIKERNNPQTGTYYIPEGQLTKAEVKKKENALYGSNVMLEFETKEAYDAKLNELKQNGERVH